MTCKYCYHYDVCSEKDGTTNFYGKEFACNDVEKRCQYFKNKSLVVELPCKIGDKAYKVIKSEHFGNHIQEMIVRKFGMFAHTNFEMIFGMENNWDVFFDKSKAEAKLKELNNEH